MKENTGGPSSSSTEGPADWKTELTENGTVTRLPEQLQRLSNCCSCDDGSQSQGRHRPSGPDEPDNSRREVSGGAPCSCGAAPDHRDGGRDAAPPGPSGRGEAAGARPDAGAEPDLPEEPRRPLDSDCCGGGCSPCVFDLYEQDMAAWRRRCERLRRGRPESDGGAPLSRRRYTPLTLLSVTPVADDAAVYRFALPAGRALRLRPGQHLVLRETDAAGRPVTRPYTPISPPHAAGYFDVYIRLYDGGAASECVRRWRPGGAALWRGPFGEYRPRRDDRRLVLLAAGTGVAPFVALVRAALADDEDETRLSLLLAARRLQDVFPRDELAEFARSWNFTYRLFISGDRDGLARYGEPVSWRRIGCQDVLEKVRETMLKTRYLVCGTPSFDKDMVNYLEAAGVARDDIFRF